MTVKLTVNPSVKGLIFDLDGTLADTMPIHYEAWKEAAKNYNFEPTIEVFHELTGIPSEKFAIRLNEIYGTNMDPIQVSRDKEKVFLRKFGSIQPITPVMDIVREYHNKLPMSIGTGGKKDIAIKIIEAVGLDKYISIIVTADDVENHKPHPDTFLKCAEHMGVDPEFCQVFEDGIQGLNAAEAANMIATDVRPFI